MLPIRIDPQALEDIRIRALTLGESPSSIAAQVLEAHVLAHPIDELTRARYREAIEKKGMATPIDLLAA